MKKFRVFLENTFVGAGAIRGAGQVTGEGPANDTNNYIGANIADADTTDNQLKKFVKSFHGDLHGSSEKGGKSKK